jgi:hypothetical protein
MVVQNDQESNRRTRVFRTIPPLTLRVAARHATLAIRPTSFHGLPVFADLSEEDLSVPL